MSQFVAAASALTGEVLAQSADPYAFTAGRTWSLVGAGLGLVGVVIGALALVRRGRWASIAVGAGVVGVGIGTWVVSAAEGGPGTGYGIVGGYIALVIGVVAIALGGLAVARSGRVATTR
ncbi:DUF6223 family protein [Actinosynnema sp. CA-248983]